MSLNNTHYGKDEIGAMLCGVHGIFFVGIGGINMSALAQLTKTLGFRVGGYDAVSSAITEKLKTLGIDVRYTHDADALEGYDALVYTVALPEDTPEYTEAVRRGLPCFSRADYLGYLMSEYPVRIGVSGMHGKSTTTAMLAKIFIDGNTNPTVMCGADVDILDGTLRIGSGEDFIFEACEYKDSFLDFYPNIAVILNIEEEHTDYFENLSHIKRSFRAFSGKCSKNGVTVANGDDENVLDALKDADTRLMTFGINNSDCDATARNISSIRGKYSFDVYIENSLYCKVKLSVGGKHNVYNALAAACVAKLCGIDGKTVSNALENFTGVGRRMEYRGDFCGAHVYSDYAHHPTEISATLTYAREMTNGRVICVFQPHTYSRLKSFFGEICHALSAADEAWLVDVYAAREKDVYGVNSEGVAKAIGERARYCPVLSDVPLMLSGTVAPDDTVIIMGAGSIVSVFDGWKLDKN